MAESTARKRGIQRWEKIRHIYDAFLYVLLTPFGLETRQFNFQPRLVARAGICKARQAKQGRRLCFQFRWIGDGARRQAALEGDKPGRAPRRRAQDLRH